MDDKRIENFVSHITVYCVKNIPATPGDSCDDVIINAYERIKTRLAEAEDAQLPKKIKLPTRTI